MLVPTSTRKTSSSDHLSCYESIVLWSVVDPWNREVWNLRSFFLNWSEIFCSRSQYKTCLFLNIIYLIDLIFLSTLHPLNIYILRSSIVYGTWYCELRQSLRRRRKNFKGDSGNHCLVKPCNDERGTDAEWCFFPALFAA